MRFLPRIKKIAGWVSIMFRNDGVYAAHVTRPSTGKPRVNWIQYLPGSQTSFELILLKLAKEKNLSKYHCLTTLEPNEYQLITVDAPNVPKEEVKSAVRWRVKDLLDFSIENACFDVIDIPVDISHVARNHSLYVAASRNELIESRQALFSASQVPLQVIDIPDMAQRNISALCEDEGRGAALLSFDSEGGLLTVTYKSELYLARRIDVSFAQLIQADSAMRDACFEKITLELQRSFDHLERQHQFISVSKLILSPMDASMVALPQFLDSNFYIPAEVLKLESVLDISKVTELANVIEQQKYFGAIGAALRHEEHLS